MTTLVLFLSPCCHAPSIPKRATEHVIIRTCSACGKDYQA